MRNFLGKVGSCSRCMRQSMAAALASWVSFAAALLLDAAPWIVAIVAVTTLLLTALWALHVATYAARTSKADAHIGRRAAMIAITRSIAVGAAVSVPAILWPGQSQAFCGQCSKNSDCGVGYTCKDTCVRTSGRTCPCYECK